MTSESYVDYAGVLAFRALGVDEPKFETKIVKVDGVDVPLIHISGVQKNSGIIVNLDIWPRNNATAEDFKKLNGAIADITFRVGYWPSVNENGEVTMRPGAPKWLSANIGGTDVKLSGEQRKYQG